MGQQRNWLQATVERNKDNTLQIKWENNIEEVCIYWSTSPIILKKMENYLQR